MRSCCVSRCTRVKVFIFLKIPGGPNINIFDENWHGASFYIKEQTQKYKLEIRLLKRTILDPQKSVFLVFEENPPKLLFSPCFGFDSDLITIDAQMFFWLIFLKTHKKVIDCQKHHFGCFWRLIMGFLYVFKNTDQNNICLKG